MKIVALKKALTMPKVAKRTHKPRSTPTITNKKGAKAVTESTLTMMGWSKTNNGWLDKKGVMRATYNTKLQAYIVKPTRSGMKAVKRSYI